MPGSGTVGILKINGIHNISLRTKLNFSANFSNMAQWILIRARAWLVTGPLGRGAAFAIDFAVAVRTGLAQRGGQPRG